MNNDQYRQMIERQVATVKLNWKFHAARKWMKANNVKLHPFAIAASNRSGWVEIQ